jgi:hypothetical protein
MSRVVGRVLGVEVEMLEESVDGRTRSLAAEQLADRDLAGVGRSGDVARIVADESEEVAERRPPDLRDQRHQRQTKRGRSGGCPCVEPSVSRRVAEHRTKTPESSIRNVCAQENSAKSNAAKRRDRAAQIDPYDTRLVPRFGRDLSVVESVELKRDDFALVRRQCRDRSMKCVVILGPRQPARRRRLIVRPLIIGGAY